MRLCTSVAVALVILSFICPSFGAAPAASPPAGGLTGIPVPVPTPRLSVPEGYRISTGDVLTIITVGEERFSQECQVNGSGTISFPVLGDVPTAGLTCAELQASLASGLSKYLRHPQSLGISVFVLGEVRTPGLYPLPNSRALTQVLAAAGGPTTSAGGEVNIIKARTGEFKTADLGSVLTGGANVSDGMLEPGDVVLVKGRFQLGQERRYAVLGEVPNPGLFDMAADSDTRVLDAMQKAGLLGANAAVNSTPGVPHGSVLEEQSRTADLEHATLTRGGTVSPLSMAALLKGDTSQNLLLKPGDVITVPRRQLISVYVMGEVRTPGRQMLPFNSTVLDLLNAAQGVTPGANLSGAAVLRQVAGKPTPIAVDLDRLLRAADSKQNVPLQEGDVLFVPTRGENKDFLHWLPIVPYLLRF
jgi:polysaccharide export outer membrane protein